MTAMKSADRALKRRKDRAVLCADVTLGLAEVLPDSECGLRRKEYQDRIRRRLAGGSEKLFRGLTGLRFEILWDSTGRLVSSPVRVPAGCAAGRGERGVCRWRQQAKGRGGNGDSSRSGHPHTTDRIFTCCRSLQNFWHPIQIEGLSLGVAVLQALSGEPGMDAPLRPRTLGVAETDRAQFERAATLLRLVIHDAVAATLAEIRSEELAHARHEAASRERETEKARQQLKRIHPQIPGPAHSQGSSSNAPAVVRLLLDFVHASYPQAISLKDFAGQHQWNAAYLSTLFATNVGVPFKRYLTDFRLEKARELLRDPALEISDVSVAVGYADPNRFRVVFKSVTGVCPATFQQGERNK